MTDVTMVKELSTYGEIAVLAESWKWKRGKVKRVQYVIRGRQAPAAEFGRMVTLLRLAGSVWIRPGDGWEYGLYHADNPFSTVVARRKLDA